MEGSLHEEHSKWTDARNWIHICLTVILFGFGFTLLMPGDTFSASHSWDQFRAISPSELWWGVVFLIAGMFGFVGLVTQNKWLNSGCTFILATCHIGVAICFYVPVYAGLTSMQPGVITYSSLAVLGYVLLWRRLRYAVKSSQNIVKTPFTAP